MTVNFKSDRRDPRIVFAGTPEFAAHILATLLAHGGHVSAVLTQPDRRAGRGRKIRASAVKMLALDHGIAVLQPRRLSADSLEEVRDFTPDVIVVAAYGLLLPENFLQLPRCGCINVHASLLPRWRGAAPIQNAILAGDSTTGVSLMRMDTGLDTGDVFARASCPIGATDNTSTLHDRLSQLGAELLIGKLHAICAGTMACVAQDNSRATYAARVQKSDARLDWTQPAIALHRQIRAYHSWPVAFTHLDSQRVRVWQASLGRDSATPGLIVAVSAAGVEVGTGSETLILEQLQLPGGRVVGAFDLANAGILRVQQRFETQGA